MKIYISSDIEGTCGIVSWDETEKGKDLYEHFARQMTREVNACCEGVLAGGADSVFVKDAHDSARNIDPEALPESVRIFRGWGRDPLSMVTGIDSTFDGVCFTGYHSASGTDCNPLSHTMNGHNNQILMNGELTSELRIHALAASYFGVPVRMLSGDRGLCEWLHAVLPNVPTVATNEGCGRGAWSMHPNCAVKQIREAAEQGMSLKKEDGLFPMPAHFDVEVNFKDHPYARSASFYPGAAQNGPRTVHFAADDYWDVLTFFHFVL